MTTEAWSGTYESVPVGASESSTRVIDARAIDAFANAIESFNPVHMDGDWVRANTNFPDRIAHGVMTTALMSPPIAAFCERWRIRTALLSTASKYIRPVVVGDIITTVIRVTDKDDERRRIRLEAKVTNQRDELVMIGEAVEQAL